MHYTGGEVSDRVGSDRVLEQSVSKSCFVGKVEEQPTKKSQKCRGVNMEKGARRSVEKLSGVAMKKSVRGGVENGISSTGEILYFQEYLQKMQKWLVVQLFILQRMRRRR